MFQVHAIQGRVFSGTLEQLRQQRLVTGVARVRSVAPIGDGTEPTMPPAAHGLAHEAALAYGATTTGRARQPLICAADVMRSPVITVPAASTLREAWQTMVRHGIGQAPVLDGNGTLIGLVGRAALLPPLSLDAPSALAEQARLSGSVTGLMWSPIPSTAPGTDLRRVAALLLDTGLPGVPVADEAGRVLGFVSRTDLLRALATAPPLDLWG